LIGEISDTIEKLSEISSTIAAAVDTSGGVLAGTSAVPVTTDLMPEAIGTKARLFPTPVATTKHGLEEICTRRPPDSMHYISLDDAMRNGKPSVVSFATPLLCQSQTCGPVVDEQMLVFQKYGPGKANFIHVEEFLPGKDLQPPPGTPQNLSPAFKASGFLDEPWVIVIDRKGIVRGRLGPGAIAAPQIEAALQPLGWTCSGMRPGVYVGFKKPGSPALYPRGSLCRPDRDFPTFVRWYTRGQLDLDALVTQRYTLEQINDAVTDLAGGRIHGRSIIMYA
jgi:hypothetical protein